MRLTIIHPCIGRRSGQSYIRTWQMEPLPAATLAGLTPPDVDVRFYDDRMETIPFDEPTDLVAMSVETYTAKRAYQIASEYRRRNVLKGYRPHEGPWPTEYYPTKRAAAREKFADLLASDPDLEKYADNIARYMAARGDH